MLIILSLVIGKLYQLQVTKFCLPELLFTFSEGQFLPWHLYFVSWVSPAVVSTSRKSTFEMKGDLMFSSIAWSPSFRSVAFCWNFHTPLRWTVLYGLGPIRRYNESRNLCKYQKFECVGVYEKIWLNENLP